MQLRRVRTEADALRRYVEECWWPCRRELAEIVGGRALADGIDDEEVVEHLRSQLDAPSIRLWVALVGGDRTAPLSTAGGELVGFVRTDATPAPAHFDWPDRLEVTDLWVRESHRGGGLLDDLLTRALQQAREDGCTELTVDVALENRRAVAAAEQRGFEVQGYRMCVPVADVTLDGDASAPTTGAHGAVRLRRLRVEEAAMRRFVEACWRPFWRALEDAVGEQHLDGALDRDALVEELLEDYDVPDRRCWIALDGAEDGSVALEDTDAVFAGWVNAGLEPTERFLDPPERLFVGNLYVADSYRGSGLADDLVRRALQYAREEGCPELSLGVEAANERALAYYEKLGFEPVRQRMAAPIETLVQ